MTITKALEIILVDVSPAGADFTKPRVFCSDTGKEIHAENLAHFLAGYLFRPGETCTVRAATWEERERLLHNSQEGKATK